MKKDEKVTQEKLNTEAQTAVAMRVCVEALGRIDPKARLRVVRAACAFYGIPVPKDAER